MKILDNVKSTVRDDLQETIKKNSKVSLPCSSEEIARRQPLRAVFRDSGFANSPSKINVGEIFKMLAPDTRIKVI